MRARRRIPSLPGYGRGVLTVFRTPPHMVSLDLLASFSRRSGGAVLLHAFSPAPMPSADPHTWTFDVTSSGNAPVRALAFGSDAGFHIISVPPQGAPDEERRAIQARLGQGDVYLVSLGWSNITVTTAAPPGVPDAPIGLRATARMMRFYRTAAGTGVRTSWR